MIDQLKIWSERAGCQFFSKGMNVDPAAVAYETVDYAIHNQCDMAIIDTAGRLHTKINLMSELGKIKRSIAKRMEGAPHEVLLVLDATTGQNAIEQAKHFSEATDVTAIALTKLDGTQTRYSDNTSCICNSHRAGIFRRSRCTTRTKGRCSRGCHHF